MAKDWFTSFRDVIKINKNTDNLFISPLPRSAYWLFLLGILVSAAFGYFVYNQVSSVVQQQAEVELERLCISASDQFQIRLQQMKYGMSQAATEQYIQEAIVNRDSALLNQLIYGWQQERDYVELWAVLDKHGSIISSLRGNDKNPVPLSLNGLIQQAIVSGSPIVTTEIITKSDLSQIGLNVIARLESNSLLIKEGALTQLVIVPVIGKDGQVLGALCAGLVLNDNQELMQGIFNQRQVFNAIYQGENCVSSITDSDMTRFPQKMSQNMTESIIFNGRGYLGEMKMGEENYVTVSRSIFNAQAKIIGYQVVALAKTQYNYLPAWVGNVSLLTALLMAMFFIIVTGNTSRLKQLFDHERQRSKESYHLRLFAQKLQECTDEDEVYLLLKQNLKRDLILNQIELNVFTDTGNCMESISFTNNLISRTFLEHEKCKPMLTGRMIVYNDSNDLPCLQVDTRLVKSHICIPFLAGGKVSGVVGLGSPEEHYWNHDRVEYLSVYLNLIGPAVTNIRLLKLLQARAFEDPLTGLKNRRFLDQYLQEQLAVAQRYEKPLSLLMADIDLFKRVNDEYGHDVGDLVLRELAATIRATARSSDLVARYGGEEFVLVLPDTDTQDAIALAERFREAIASMQVIHGDYGEALNITISIGAASFPNDGNTMDSLYKLADSALYLAKNRGRNQVRSAQEYLETLRQ